MLTLYGVARSRASRPLWLLAEIGQPFTHTPIIQAYRLPDPKAKDAPPHTDSASFRAINPMGQIPTLQDGTLILNESMAICLHIARKYGGALGPQSLAEAAEIDQWGYFAATNIESAALTLLQSTDPATLATARAALRRPLAYLETMLAPREWLLDRFTVADILLAECLRYAAGDAALMADHPVTTGYLARCHARPAFQTMWQARLAEPA